MPNSRAPTRSVFYISDGTGITAETLGQSLLTQFEGLPTRATRMPFVDSVDKAHACVLRINAAHQADQVRPIVFNTLVNVDISQVIHGADALVLDLFQTFIKPLEKELGLKSTHTMGRSHSATKNQQEYTNRIEAINFSLAHDDGQTDKNLAEADVILIGVSRSGKTPTSLYLALTFGLRCANYPLIPEDFERNALPATLAPFRAKLFGLTIEPKRLAEIRNERRPNSKYASIENCRHEVHAAEALMRREGIRWLSSTTKSIEEIATTVMQEIKLERRVF
ncbi:MAG: kinase/pyrophosphorylase [Burkholderiales bacterium]|nr:kinase/pyrophosphorylase [Burkholderiales bacterium]